MRGSESRTLVGRVAGIHRYPVKSMQGESLARVTVGPDGLDGDRRFAVMDAETGRIASAKNPRKWAGLIGLSAKLYNGALVVTASDGTELGYDREKLDAKLSSLTGRAVRLLGTPVASAVIEIEWPNVKGVANAGTVFTEELPAGGFFDLAPIHLLTTSTLSRLRELTPDADFDPRRFRANVIIETLPTITEFVESEWVGRSLLVGEAKLEITAPCSRCVMTTLAQPGLAADKRILRAAVKYNATNVGMYACATYHCEIAEGDSVWLI